MNILFLTKTIKKKYQYFFLSPLSYALKQGVKIGNNCSIATRYFGSEPYLIEIGNHVQVTSGVKFFTHGAAWCFRQQYPNFDFFGKIKIGNNVYIGNNALIMPGVTVGDNVIIGAGSIVTKSIKNGLIVAGTPAKVIGNIEDFKEKIKKYNLETKGMSEFEKKKYLLSLTEDKFIRK